MTSTTKITADIVKAAEQSIRDEFFSVDDTLLTLKQFIAASEAAPLTSNVILYGPGGYGKSEMSAKFLQEITGERPFVVNMNQSTTTGEIWGGMDIEKFRQGQGIHYLLARSFMNHRYVIFEEGLEPRPKVLSALKHLITSGIFEVAGVEPHEVKTVGIIIVTNIDTEMFNDTDENRAFLERFPLRQRVSWDFLNVAQRIDASMKVIDKFDINNRMPQTMRQIIAERATASKLSPRMIGRIVSGMVSYQEMFVGGKKVDDATFSQLAAKYGIAQEADLAEQVQNYHVKQNVDETKKKLEKIFEVLGKRTGHILGLNNYLSDPMYVARICRQIKSTQNFINAVQDSVADIRTDPEYGDLGAELASWANERLAGYHEQIDQVRDVSWDGLLNTVIALSDEVNALKQDVEEPAEDTDDDNAE